MKLVKRRVLEKETMLLDKETGQIYYTDFLTPAQIAKFYTPDSEVIFWYKPSFLSKDLILKTSVSDVEYISKIYPEYFKTLSLKQGACVLDASKKQFKQLQHYLRNFAVYEI